MKVVARRHYVQFVHILQAFLPSPSILCVAQTLSISTNKTTTFLRSVKHSQIVQAKLVFIQLQKKKNKKIESFFFIITSPA